ncbi:ROK family protein [Sphingomonas sp. AP4-R1]|uniref:ROK family protein n=1 Tax=Sphingomonas sp. AP4-R1 TaxID=2735134 RepID=UPI001493D612|nr:ROK family protein [Sphingomonas sp. AP4-R1]QJU60271.1 ROK family protein [Sphingomonas sp. AP4-R1]
MMTAPLFAAIEAGGTKFLCAVMSPGGEVLTQARIATSTPDETFAAVRRFFRSEREKRGAVAAAGVASFGPLDLDPASPGYGRLTSTPKPSWSSVDMRGIIEDAVGAPTVIDTDVNCAGLAEVEQGAGRGLHRVCYVTVGTGIGVGVIEQGKPLGGIGHAEAGHIRMPRAPGDAQFPGICPYHTDCLEGLACGPAMAMRWGMPAETLGDGHPGWAIEAHYLGALCADLTYVLRPERIILGGGVLAHRSLLDLVREQFATLTAGYALDRCSADPATFIAAPLAEEPSPGLIGALALARTQISVSA